EMQQRDVPGTPRPLTSIDASHGAGLLPVAASTTIAPVMCGCSEQKYSYVPGVLNVNENLSSVSSTFDLNSFALDITVCGISSALVHVTVVPAFTVMRCGLNVKLSTFTLSSSARAGVTGIAVAEKTASCSVAAASAPRTRSILMI